MDLFGKGTEEEYFTPYERVTPSALEEGRYIDPDICSGTRQASLVLTRHDPTNPIVDRDGSSTSTLTKHDRRCCDPVRGAWQNTIHF